MIFEEYSNVIELLIVGAGGLGLLQKVADMERYHQLRVVVLSTLFSLITILFMISFIMINAFRLPACFLGACDHPEGYMHDQF